MDKFDAICKAIKEVKIQGAENVAKAAIEALKYKSDNQSIKKLISLRPTEPCLRNSMKFVTSGGKISEALAHFDLVDRRLNEYGSKKIEDGYRVFTHCHSSSVINILLQAKKEGKKFKVYNTETRPLMQGRVTAKELAKAGIPVVHFIDSAARIGLKKADLMLIGCDAITTDKVFNKVGTEMFAEIAYRYDVPVYVCTDSWKFDVEGIYGEEEPIEKRPTKEVWSDPPKNVKVLNPAFEKINPHFITSIISELGEFKLSSFVSEIKKVHPWMFR